MPAPPMDYKERFFERYVSTHTGHRDGARSLAQFKQQATHSQRRWRGFFPAGRAARLLNIGCSNGNLVWWLQQAGYASCKVIDVSAELVADARNATGVAMRYPLWRGVVACSHLLPFAELRVGRCTATQRISAAAPRCVTR